jgi:hypothetical protein
MRQKIVFPRALLQNAIMRRRKAGIGRAQAVPFTLVSRRLSWLDERSCEAGSDDAIEHWKFGRYVRRKLCYRPLVQGEIA